MRASCETSGKNTGRGKCDLYAIIADTILMTPEGATIPKDADIMDYLIERVNDPNPKTRWYPIRDVEDTTNNSTDPTAVTLGVGWSRNINSGMAAFAFVFVSSECMNQILLPYEGWRGGMFILDSNENVLGSINSNGDLQAIKPKSVDVSVNVIGTTSEETQDLLIVNFGDKNQFARKARQWQIEDADFTLLKGIQDVIIAEEGSTSTSITVSVEEECGGDNLFDYYETQLSTTAVWRLTSTAGASIVPSGITPNTSSKTFTISFTGTLATVSLAPIDVLEENGITGYESNTLKV